MAEIFFVAEAKSIEIANFFMKRFHIINEDNFYSDLTTDSECDDVEDDKPSQKDDAGDFIIELPFLSNDEEDNDPVEASCDQFASCLYDDDSIEEEKKGDANEEEEEEKEAKEINEKLIRKQNKKVADKYVLAVEKIYNYFNKKYSYELILNAIHSNAGSLQNAIYDLAKTPSMFVDISLSKPPIKEDLPLRYKLQYTNR